MAGGAGATLEVGVATGVVVLLDNSLPPPNPIARARVAAPPNRADHGFSLTFHQHLHAESYCGASPMLSTPCPYRVGAPSTCPTQVRNEASSAIGSGCRFSRGCSRERDCTKHTCRSARVRVGQCAIGTLSHVARLVVVVSIQRAGRQREPNLISSAAAAAAADKTAPRRLSLAPVSVVAGSTGRHSRVRHSQEDYRLRPHGRC